MTFPSIDLLAIQGIRDCFGFTEALQSGTVRRRGPVTPSYQHLHLAIHRGTSAGAKGGTVRNSGGAFEQSRGTHIDNRTFKPRTALMVAQESGPVRAAS